MIANAQGMKMNDSRQLLGKIETNSHHNDKDPKAIYV